MASQNVPLYEFSVTIFNNGLKNLVHIMDKAEQYAKEKGEDVEQYTKLKIYPDMRDFTFQIYRVFAAVNMVFTEIPSTASTLDRSAIEMPDTEYTWSELKTRLTKAVDFLNQSAKPEDFAGQEGKTVSFYGGQFKFAPQQFLQTIALPNFFFHVTTAYDLLRAAGVPLSKVDYLFGPAAASFQRPSGASSSNVKTAQSS